MTDNIFNAITDIQMSLQTAEHHLHHNNFSEQLHLSFALVTIARGSCSMVIRPDGTPGTTPFGQLHIPADRAVMKGNVSLGKDDFDMLAAKLHQPATRPISTMVKLDRSLTIDRDGVLFIEGPVEAAITNMFWVLPLK